MTLALNEQQFALFNQFLKCGSSLPILKAASVVGNQMEDMRWVLGQDIQLSKDGVPINPLTLIDVRVRHAPVHL